MEREIVETLSMISKVQNQQGELISKLIKHIELLTEKVALLEKIKENQK